MIAAEDDKLREPRIAVILAAGRGERLRPHGRSCPKPLTPVLGVSLAERVVRGLLEATPLETIVVSIGYEAEAIRQHFEDIGARSGIPVRFVSADQWQSGNGASALATATATDSRPFLLTMADHLVSPALVADLLVDPPEVDEVCLAVDRDKAAVFDLDDVTRVRLAGNRVAAIGKNLDVWEAADTGVFLCTSALYDGLAEAAARGRHGLSDGISMLAAKGQARAVDVSGRWWTDVDTPAALKHAEARLVAQLGCKPHDGPVARYLNRPLSRRLTRHLVRTSITPNQISVLVFLLACVASALLAAPGYAALVAGGLLAQVSSVLDGCDGEIARLKFNASEFGGWFDAVLDRYADALILFALTWHALYTNPAEVCLAAGFAAVIGSFLNSYTADKYDQLMLQKVSVALRIGRDIRIFIVFIGALLDQTLLALWSIALLMNAEVVRRIYLYYVAADQGSARPRR